MKKAKTSLLLFLVLFLLLLSGCTDDSGAPTTPNSILPDTQSDITGAFRGKIFGMSNFAGAGDRTYEITDTKHIYVYTDSDTRPIQPKESICKKPGCMHEGTSCNAYIGASFLLATEHELYYFRADQEQSVSLYRCDLNGENRQLVMQLWDGYTTDLYEAYLANGHIYYTKRVGLSTQIWDVDLSNLSQSVVANEMGEEGVFTHILDIADGILYYQIDYGDPTLPDKSTTPPTLSFNNFGYDQWYKGYSTGSALYRVEPGKQPELLKEDIMASSFSSGCNGCVYYVSKDKHSIYQYDLTTATEYLVYTGEGPYSINEYAFDNRLIIHVKQEDEPARIFMLNLSTRELIPMSTFAYDSNRRFSVLYLHAASNKYYLAEYSLEGNDTVEFDHMLSLIPKQQFEDAYWYYYDWVPFS